MWAGWVHVLLQISRTLFIWLHVLSGVCSAWFILAMSLLCKFNHSAIRSKSIIWMMSQELLRIPSGSPSARDLHVQCGNYTTPPVSLTIKQTTKAMRAWSWLWLHLLLKNFSAMTSVMSHSCGYYCTDYGTTASVLLTLIYAFKTQWW